MKTEIYLFEAYKYGEGWEMPEYLEYMAQTIKEASEKLLADFPKAHILNTYIKWSDEW